MARAFTARSFGIRWAVAAVLVFGTFNPSGLSYWHWLTAAETGVEPLPVIVGLALLIAYIVYLRATWRSIGPVGALLVVAFLGGFVWLFNDFGLLDLTAVTPMTWVGLLIVSIVLAIGISWSHIRRRISGQLDTDDVGQATEE